MAFQVSDIADSFGSGGANLVPNQGIPNLRDILRDILGRIAAPAANVAALQATLAVNRANGQQVTTLDTYTSWVWRPLDATAPDATHVAPFDVGAGAGRWVAEVSSAPTPASVGLSTGTSTLVNGISPIIPATITATSKIVVTRNSLAGSTAIGELLTGNRVNGAPGSFRVSSEKDDMTGVQVGDQSVFDWQVIG